MANSKIIHYNKNSEQRNKIKFTCVFEFQLISYYEKVILNILKVKNVACLK